MPPDLIAHLKANPTNWLVTGAAGFIGSNLVEALLKAEQTVVGLDNFVTGRQTNLDDIRMQVEPAQWARFRFLNGDICDPAACAEACQGVRLVLHQAALGSVPRSLKDPLATHRANVTGYLTVLEAARLAGIRRVVYASSSSVYGDHPGLPKVEDRIGRPLSPYAATKAMNEQYADIYARCFGMELIGLRYFNVFGRRQDPDGAYAAVIPRWIAQMLRGEACHINGDGETSRDFCYIANVVQINIRAAITVNTGAVNRAYNVACGHQTTLSQLHAHLRGHLPGLTDLQRRMVPIHEPFRPGDIRHSLADIEAARSLLGYEPSHQIDDGLMETLPWYYASLCSP